jgi:hypothetical protein
LELLEICKAIVNWFCFQFRYSLLKPISFLLWHGVVGGVRFSADVWPYAQAYT